MQQLRIQKVLEDKEWMRFLTKWMLVSLVIHFICSVFSLGFHHFDEHFQIIEFLNLKFGGTTTGNLPWEYHERMRPWLQPWFYYMEASLLKFFGIESREIWTFVFRFSSSIIGWLSLWMIGLLSYFWFDEENYYSKQWKKWSVYFLCFVWFIPYIHARTSSDNLGASVFLIGVLFILLLYPVEYDSGCLRYNSLKPKWAEKRYRFPHWAMIAAGIIFGLSFQFRHQMGLNIFFFFLWCLFYGRMSFLSGLIMTTSLICSLGIGIWVDWWGYGEVTLPVIQYFYIGAIVGHAGKVLPNPWWDYFRLTLLRGIPPVSLLFIVGTLIFWWRKRTHPLTWVTLPFFVTHCYLLHKELRYIFLIVLLAPTMSLLAVQWPQLLARYPILKKRGVRYFINLSIFINMILLIFSSLKPANVAVSFYRHLNNKKGEIKELIHKGENPLTMVGHPLKFYWPYGLVTKRVEGMDQIKAYFKKARDTVWLATTRGKDYFIVKDLFANCKLDYLTYPNWILHFNIGRWVERSRVWALFKCHSP